MTRLIITSAADPKDARLDTEDFGVIAGELAAIPAPKQSFSEGKMLVLGGNELPVPPASISSR